MSLVRQMNYWKRAAFVNGFGLIGILLSMFALPESLPLWIWAVSSFACLVVLNLAAFWKKRSQSEASQYRLSRTTLVTLGGILLLIIDLVWSCYAEHR